MIEVKSNGETRDNRKPWNLSPDKSCALDMAQDGSHTLKEIGDALGLTRERIRQVLVDVFDKIRQNDDGLEVYEVIREMAAAGQDKPGIDEDFSVVEAQLAGNCSTAEAEAEAES